MALARCARLRLRGRGPATALLSRGSEVHPAERQVPGMGRKTARSGTVAGNARG